MVQSVSESVQKHNFSTTDIYLYHSITSTASNMWLWWTINTWEERILNRYWEFSNNKSCQISFVSFTTNCFDRNRRYWKCFISGKWIIEDILTIFLRIFWQYFQHWNILMQLMRKAYINVALLQYPITDSYSVNNFHLVSNWYQSIFSTLGFNLGRCEGGVRGVPARWYASPSRPKAVLGLVWKKCSKVDPMMRKQNLLRLLRLWRLWRL